MSTALRYSTRPISRKPPVFGGRQWQACCQSGRTQVSAQTRGSGRVGRPHSRYFRRQPCGAIVRVRMPQPFTGCGAVSLSCPARLAFERAGFEHLSPAGTAVPASGAVGVHGCRRDRDQTAAVRAGRVQFHLDKVGERRRGVSADSGVQSCTSR